MEPQPGKLFVANLPKEINEAIMKEHFNQYGEVKDCVIIVDKITGNIKGFGFVAFTDPLVATKALEEEHFILGRKVDVKQALKKGEKSEIQAYFKTCKIFVGGLPDDLTEEEFKNYFDKFGTITVGVIIRSKETFKSKGFGFITFDSEEAVDDAMQQTHHELNGKSVKVKRAEPKRENRLRYTYDCNKVGLDFGSSHQFANGGHFWYYPNYCFSCLVPYGYGHNKGCLFDGQNTVGNVSWLPSEAPTRLWNASDLQTNVCPSDDSANI